MNRLKELRIQNNKTQSQVADWLSITQAAYSKYECGKSEPSLETLSILCEKYSVSLNYLLGRENKSPALQNAINYDNMDLYPVPLLGHVVAGVPIESQENFEGYVYINHKPKEEFFALKVFGDSMINAGIPDGAILIVHKQAYAENGNIVVAFLNGEQTVKYFKVSEEDMYLVPANNNYLPIPVRKNDDFLILGKVVEIRINL